MQNCSAAAVSKFDLDGSQDGIIDDFGGGGKSERQQNKKSARNNLFDYK